MGLINDATRGIGLVGAKLALVVAKREVTRFTEVHPVGRAIRTRIERDPTELHRPIDLLANALVDALDGDSADAAPPTERP